MAQHIPERPDRRPRQPRCQFFSLRPQLRRGLAEPFEDLFIRIARSTVGLKRSMIDALQAGSPGSAGYYPGYPRSAWPAG